MVARVEATLLGASNRFPGCCRISNYFQLLPASNLQMTNEQFCPALGFVTSPISTPLTLFL